MKPQIGCSSMTPLGAGLISTLPSGLHWLRGRTSARRRLISKYAREDWRRRRARGPCCPRRSPTTSMMMMMTRRLSSELGRRWRWPRPVNAKGGRTPLLVKFGSCRKMLPSGWRVATRTRTSVAWRRPFFSCYRASRRWRRRYARRHRRVLRRRLRAWRDRGARLP